MNSILKLNIPAVSTPVSVKELDIRLYTNGAVYMDGTKILKSASVETPLYRLCKDYDMDGVKFSLNMVITDTDAGKAEKFLDKTAKSITAEQVKNIRTPYVWLDNQYEVK